MKSCAFRVWDNGDMDSCNDLAVFDGNYPRCKNHAKIEIESHDEEIKRLQLAIEDRKSRRDLLAKSIGADYAVQQPAPNDDLEMKPIWTKIIADCEHRAAEHFRVGRQSDEIKAKSIRAMVEDMRKRHEFGVAKNDRDHLSDAYQEFLDAIVYLRAEIEKSGGLPNCFHAADFRLRTIVRMYSLAIDDAIELRTILAERDGR